MGPSCELGSPGGGASWGSGGVQCGDASSPAGVDLTVLTTQEVDFTLTFTTRSCKYWALVPQPWENRPHSFRERAWESSFASFISIPPPTPHPPSDSFCPTLGQLSPHPFCPLTPDSVKRTTLVTRITRAAIRQGKPSVAPTLS